MKSFPKKPQVKTAEKAAEIPLGAVNYIMIALGVLVLAGSYGIMFLEKEVDGFFALFISPVALVSAYGWIIFAILHRPTQKNNR